MIFFPELVTQRAATTPLNTAYQFFQGPSLDPVRLSFNDLHEQASGLAGWLAAQDVAGQRVMIGCKSQQHFVVAFFACLMAGAVAVPTALPRRRQTEDRFKLLAADAGLSAIIVDSDDIPVAELARELPLGIQVDMREWTTRTDLAQWARTWRLPAPGPASPAFLQYTSGSTGEPKGAVVSHANLVW